MMFVLLVTIGTIIVSAPIAVAMLVSVASRREESAHSLSGQAPGPITRAARRLLAYKSQTGTASSWTTGDELRARNLFRSGNELQTDGGTSTSLGHCRILRGHREGGQRHGIENRSCGRSAKPE